MDSGIIKKANLDFISRFPITMPSMGWYFSSVAYEDAIELSSDLWICMLLHE